MAERGILSNNYKLVNKLENYLGINLRKKRQIPEADISSDNLYEDRIVAQIKENPQDISFDNETNKTLTISDLQEMKKKKEKEIFEKDEKDFVFNENNFGESSDEKPEFVKKNDDLSQDEIDDLIFGRK